MLVSAVYTVNLAIALPVGGNAGSALALEVIRTTAVDVANSFVRAVSTVWGVIAHPKVKDALA